MRAVALTGERMAKIMGFAVGLSLWRRTNDVGLWALADKKRPHEEDVC